MDSKLQCLLPTVGTAVSGGVRLGNTSHGAIPLVLGVALASLNRRCRSIRLALSEKKIQKKFSPLVY